MQILVATTNPHKLEEMNPIFREFGIEAIGLSAIQQQIPEPDENQDTFLGNAELKALYYAKETRIICLADDSGLVVDTLSGRPGVHSARYAGHTGTRAERDAANNAKLLGELTGIPEAERSARFVCAMCCASPDGRIIAVAEGAFGGRIGFELRGQNGFGYDPLLVLEDGRTAAELSPDEKNERSHRGQAVREIAPKLREALGVR